MKEKTTLNALARMLERGFTAVADDIGATRSEMVTRKDLGELRSEIGDRLFAVENKLAGVDRRLDGEAMQRTELKIPEPLAAVERHLGLNREIHA